MKCGTCDSSKIWGRQPVGEVVFPLLPYVVFSKLTPEVDLICKFYIKRVINIREEKLTT